MEFVLIWEWVDEDDGYRYEQHTDWFDTKEELMEAYHNARMEFMAWIKMERLHLHGAVRYSWEDLDRNF